MNSMRGDSMAKKNGFSLGFQNSQRLNVRASPASSHAQVQQTLNQLSELKKDVRRLNESLKQSQDQLRENLRSNKPK